VQIEHGCGLAGVEVDQDDDIAAPDVGDRGEAGGLGADGRAFGEVDIVGAGERAEKLLKQVGRFVGDAAACDTAGGVCGLRLDCVRSILSGGRTQRGRSRRMLRTLGQGLQAVDDRSHGFVPCRGAESAVLADHGGLQAVGMVDVLVEEAALIADPLVVDGHVFARDDAAQGVHALVEAQVAADGAVGADAGRLAKLPRPVFEARDAVGQRADRANVDDAARGLRIHRLSGEDVNDRLAPALEQADLRLVLPLFEIADAAPAKDAALLVEHDQVADRVVLLLAPLGLHEFARARAILHRVVLQRALAAFVADRAVERVVDENEAEDGLPRLPHCLAVGDHRHAFAHADRTCCVKAASARAGKFDQAHAARAQGVQLGV